MSLTKRLQEAAIRIQPYKSNVVGWVSGDYLEVIESAYYQVVDIPCPPQPERQGKSPRDSDWRAAYRAQKTVRRLVNTNRLYYMATLTFALKNNVEGYHFSLVPRERQVSRDEVYQIWKFFLRRLKRKVRLWDKLKWLMVLERHDSYRTHPMKRDTYHFHVAMNRDLGTRFLQRVWRHGIVNYQDFTKSPDGQEREQIENPGAYISKYISKEGANENRELGQRRYSSSRNLEKPYKSNIVGIVKEWESVSGAPIFESEKTVESPDKLWSVTKKYRTYRVRDREEMVCLRDTYLKNGGSIHDRQPYEGSIERDKFAREVCANPNSGRIGDTKIKNRKIKMVREPACWHDNCRDTTRKGV
jgi:hypothetical protein